MAGADNLIGHGFDERSADEARESGRKGGIASGVSRRKHKAIRELLLAELRKVGPNGLTKEEYLVAKALENHAKGKLTFKDLQDLQQLLGEAVEKHEMNVQGRVEYVPEGVDELIKKHCK
jgi:hypothetical protein